MSDRIPFEKGLYLAEQALLVAPDDTAVTLEETVIEVYRNYLGKRRFRGRAFVFNALVVSLLDDNDHLDIALNLGGPYKYRIEKPELVAGKVFAPEIKSVLQFAPVQPWEPLSEAEFEVLVSGLKLLSSH